MKRLSDYAGLPGWLLLTGIAASIGAVPSAQAPIFYEQLVRPSWSPPAWLFGPVWSVLYALMGIGAWLIWREGGFARRRGALSLYGVQLVANVLWAWLFFGWHLGAPAFADIMLLWLLILATLGAFWRVRHVAGLLLIPYWCWVSFASVLNFVIWQMNRQVLG